MFLCSEKPKLAEEIAVKVTGVANSEAEATFSKLEIVKLHLEVTDDIVSSESKLHALYLKWLSYFDHHFDVEDEKAFKERFENFKKAARSINQ
ncbi:hypothetical protein MKX03_016129 [Papaver bracteatum]|nr:hypothetical protein MKX03_016129 [Papaver bracteatum]